MPYKSRWLNLDCETETKYGMLPSEGRKRVWKLNVQVKISHQYNNTLEDLKSKLTARIVTAKVIKPALVMEPQAAGIMKCEREQRHVVKGKQKMKRHHDAIEVTEEMTGLADLNF